MLVLVKSPTLEGVIHDLVQKNFFLEARTLLARPWSKASQMEVIWLPPPLGDTWQCVETFLIVTLGCEWLLPFGA